MKLITKIVEGAKDILPADSYKWQFVEDIMRGQAQSYGFKEIRTPVFEHTVLFNRSVGDTTDIVQKEMYTFDTKGGDSLSLKPEGTAGAARAMLEHKLFGQLDPLSVHYNLDGAARKTGEGIGAVAVGNERSLQVLASVVVDNGQRGCLSLYGRLQYEPFPWVAPRAKVSGKDSEDVLSRHYDVVVVEVQVHPNLIFIILQVHTKKAVGLLLSSRRYAN